MLLILSCNDDVSTDIVIDWLNDQGISWLRVNETDRIKIVNIEFKNSKVIDILISINDKTEVHLNKLTAYWYRRGFLNVDAHMPSPSHISNNEILNAGIMHTLKDDVDNTLKFIHHYLDQKVQNINSYHTSVNSKIYYLHNASVAGLRIPNTKICTNKEDLLSFFSKNGKNIITKSINEGLMVKAGNWVYYNETKAVSLEEILNAPPDFFPSLFQENLPKFIELRVFYLHERCYTMAIFSQNNAKTQQDYRNYDLDNPNRTVPFQLPATVIEAIVFFMKSINLNSGSLDFILTENGEYFFLEVNPVGQFSMVSVPCNYHIEKIIAQTLNDIN